MRTNRLLLVCVAAVIAIVFGWWIASPHLTANAFEKALEKRDADAIIGFFEFDALRANLRKEVEDGLPPECREEGRCRVQKWLSAKAVNLFASEQSFRKLFSTANWFGEIFGTEGGASSSGGADIDYRVYRTGLNTFVLGEKDDRSGFGFTRRGLAWKVTHFQDADEN
ncbi:MAG: DUF2939 domain-containing protein [Amphiplicatus sp.]